jgi:hypothetical protein
MFHLLRFHDRVASEEAVFKKEELEDFRSFCSFMKDDNSTGLCAYSKKGCRAVTLSYDRSSDKLVITSGFPISIEKSSETLDSVFDILSKS